MLEKFPSRPANTKSKFWRLWSGPVSEQLAVTWSNVRYAGK